MSQCGVHKDMAADLEVPGCLAENGDLACCKSRPNTTNSKDDGYE